MDFNGYILFTINRFLVFEGKKIDRCKIPVFFFILVDLRMELYMLVGVIIQKNMIKAVIYQKLNGLDVLMVIMTQIMRLRHGMQ